MLDTPTSGYVTALIRNERIKFFTISGTAAKAADVGNVRQITGFKLKLTQAGANYVNQALKRKPPASSSGTAPVGSTPGSGSGTVTVAPGLLGTLPGGGAITPPLPGTTVDTDGDGKPDTGMTILPIDEAD